MCWDCAKFVRGCTCTICTEYCGGASENVRAQISRNFSLNFEIFSETKLYGHPTVPEGHEHRVTTPENPRKIPRTPAEPRRGPAEPSERPRGALGETPAEPSERQISSESLAEGCAPRMVTLRNFRRAKNVSTPGLKWRKHGHPNGTWPSKWKKMDLKMRLWPSFPFGLPLFRDFRLGAIFQGCAPAEWNLREIFRFSHRFWHEILVKFSAAHPNPGKRSAENFTKISRQISRHVWQRKTEKNFTSALLQGSCSDHFPFSLQFSWDIFAPARFPFCIWPLPSQP